MSLGIGNVLWQGLATAASGPAQLEIPSTPLLDCELVLPGQSGVCIATAQILYGICGAMLGTPKSWSVMVGQSW